MPFLPSENKFNKSMTSRENFQPPSRPEPQHRPEPLHALPQKSERRDHSLFGGKTHMSVYQFERLLDGHGGNDRVRRELAQKFDAPVWSEKMDAIVKEMKEKLPEHIRRDGIIRKDEIENMYDIRHHGMDEYYEHRKDAAEKSNQGFTQKETWAISRTDQIRKEMKDIFGAGKSKDKKA